jgi:uncharacterized protein YciI
VSGHFLVRQARGPAWDPALARREQPGWDEHAAFVDRLTDEGRVLLGGPVDDVDGEYALLVVIAEDEAGARAIFDADPWRDGVLRIVEVERWSLWIGAERLRPDR